MILAPPTEAVCDISVFPFHCVIRSTRIVYPSPSPFSLFAGKVQLSCGFACSGNNKLRVDSVLNIGGGGGRIF